MTSRNFCFVMVGWDACSAVDCLGHGHYWLAGMMLATGIFLSFVIYKTTPAKEEPDEYEALSHHH